MTTQETAIRLQGAVLDCAPLLAALARGVEEPSDLCAYQRGPLTPALSDPENALAFVVEQVGGAALAAMPADPPDPPPPFAYLVP